MILSGVFLLTLHIDRCYAEELGLRTGQRDLRAPVLRPIHLDCCTPAFFVADALADILAKVLVERIARTIMSV